MLKKHFSFLLILVAFSLTAQDANKFMGFVKLNDTLLITYKLEFDINKGKVSGYSLTDFGGDHETKSRIEGEYSAEKKLISFKEVELIYTKSPVSLDEYDFCQVHVSPTRYRQGSDKFMAKFDGKFSDGVKCLSGELAMNSVSKINKRVDKFSKKIQKSKRVADSLKEKFKNSRLIDTLNLNVLKKNQTTSILTSSKSLEFFIYDGGQLDDDIISIKKNGKLILSNYKITHEKKLIRIPTEDKKIQLEIISNSVGSIGSNTAIIEILDGKNDIKAMTNLEKGETTKIDIIKRN
ncbi:MAG: hypothetical protein ED556_06835 [Winogradskyella sp.]|uniref:hypothetical protein n=1 Tax=Winogradskyella sp. TaxID=1883156 RepID=UPI000F413870|nr:hypothetical protein [Winogradskyella sp.]RNC87132.1 MAG: hypothetical protein ED556_06835 [Winogradskyella sp.]